MGGVAEKKPGASSLAHDASAGPVAPGPGKRTLTEQLPSGVPSSALPATSPAGTVAGPSTPASTVLPPVEAYHASTSSHDPNAPASRNADWEHVEEAGADAHAQESLDIAWIEALPAHLKNSIDEGFADSVAEAATAAAVKTDSGLKTIGKDIDQREKDLQAVTIERIAHSDPAIKRKHGRALDEALGADPAYAATREQLEVERTTRVEQRKSELRASKDGPMAAGGREDTVAKPATATVPRLEGRALARTNFMSWAIDILGSTEAAKRHFLSIHEVSRQPGMFLVDAAKTRFEAARADFEAKHPGYTFPSTDVAQSLRGFHQARQGIGMLGHALGIAFDLLAFDNPNQKLGSTDNFGYLLDRVGGAGDTRGRSVMTLGSAGEETISQLGRDTAANRSTPAGEAMVAKIRDQFAEMVATSERLQASMQSHLPELGEARDDYFNSKDLEKELAQATKDEKNGDKIADKRLKDETFSGDDTAKAARREAIKNELASKKEQLAEALQGAKDRVPQRLEHAFAEWSATIGADLAAAQGRQATSDAETAAQTRARQELDAIDFRAADAIDALNAFADKYQLKKRAPAPPPANYKLILKSELAAKQKPRDKNDPLSPAYIQSEIAVLKTWQARLHDPKFVFGDGYVVPGAAPTTATASTTATTPPGATAAAGPAQPSAQAVTSTGTSGAATSTAAAPAALPASSAPTGAAPTGAAPTDAPHGKHWGTKMRVTNAPLMQFVEHGFIRHDDMPVRQGAHDTKQVFNAEVAATLARFGFSPGASYRDTMHFDFIEGYSAAPGGRGPANMAKSKYGPSGDIPPPAPKAAAATAAKKDPP